MSEGTVSTNSKRTTIRMNSQCGGLLWRQLPLVQHERFRGTVSRPSQQVARVIGVFSIEFFVSQHAVQANGEAVVGRAWRVKPRRISVLARRVRRADVRPTRGVGAYGW